MSRTHSIAVLMRALLASAIALMQACGTGGEADTPSCALCGERNDIVGSIANQSGSQAQMAGWVVVSFQKDGIARVGEVDRAGLFKFGQVKTEEPQTLALLSPDYIIQSVLSIPGMTEKTIRQWVRYTRGSIPKLIHKGPIISFQDFNGLTIERDVASDQNGDLIPDGSVSLGAAQLGLNLLQAGASQDLDMDGTPNIRDPDIDGDGIINVLDPDDNGNGILDIFDGDANGDLVNDTAPGGQQNLDAYFNEGVEFISVQFSMKPKDDGSGNETTLTFTTKVRDDVTPLAVQIRGAPSLLNAALYPATDAAGATQMVAWNRLLQDDGLSEDANAGDRLFAKKVILDAAKSPRSHEMVFFQLAFGTPEEPWYLEYPYAFPPIKPAAISTQYDANQRFVLLVGNPFGEIQDFIWSINVFDETGTTIWTSQGIPGTTRQFQVQENVLVPGKAYKYSVVAQVLDKIPGYPAYTIHSAKVDLR